MDKQATRSEHDEQLLRGYTGSISIILGLGMVGTMLVRQLLPPLLPEIIETLSITPFEAGMLVAVVWAAFGLFQYPGGRISDEISRSVVIAGGLSLTILGSVLIFLLPTYAGALVGAALIGAGGSFYVLPTRAMLADMFVERRGFAFGINQAAAQLGGTLAGGVAVVVLMFATWSTAFLVIVPLLGAPLLLLFSHSREEHRISVVTFEFRTAAKRIFRQARVRLLFVSYSLFVFTVQAVLSFLPTFLRETKGFDPALATAGFSLTFFGALAVMPIAGRLGDQYDRLGVAMFALGGGGLGLLFVLLTPSRAPIVFGILLFSAGMWSYPPVMQAYIMELFPDRSMGGDFGVFRTGYFLIGSSGPAYVGFLASRVGYEAAFGTIVLCIAVGASFTYVATRQA